MAVFNEPTKWAQTLGQDADVTTIPNTAGDTDPSIDKIFPAVFSIPLAQGGRAIPRSVLNGLFKLLGDWIYYSQNGGIASYSNAFDYAEGSFVKYNNEFYRCIQTNGASTEVKAPTEIAYWSKITTLADVANAFSNQDLSNITDTANILIAHNAMPGNTYVDLTLGLSGDFYRAPADGYILFSKTATASGQATTITTMDSSFPSIAVQGYSSTPTGVVALFLPVKKNQNFQIGWNLAGTLKYFRFVYAVGSESEN